MIACRESVRNPPEPNRSPVIYCSPRERLGGCFVFESPEFQSLPPGIMPAIEVRPIPVGDRIAIGIQLELPKTRLVAISTGKGYVMCGALDVELLNTRLAERGIVAGRALGVRDFTDLLERPLVDVTDAALVLGVRPGMSGRAALDKMF